MQGCYASGKQGKTEKVREYSKFPKKFQKLFEIVFNTILDWDFRLLTPCYSESYLKVPKVLEIFY